MKRILSLLLGFLFLPWSVGAHYLYDPYFGDKDKAEWFLTHICTYEWNQILLIKIVPPIERDITTLNN